MTAAASWAMAHDRVGQYSARAREQLAIENAQRFAPDHTGIDETSVVDV
ncbi:MAG TPA: hypothetical protein VEI83_17165 [Acidimicrobiales bacterium]|nr:hypothetical protein [Acidimicrobiales bacterium]